MNSFKKSLCAATALAMMFVGTAANAEVIRSGSAIPGVVSVKKIKNVRTVAPAKREARAVPPPMGGGGGMGGAPMGGGGGGGLGPLQTGGIIAAAIAIPIAVSGGNDDVVPVSPGS